MPGGRVERSGKWVVLRRGHRSRAWNFQPGRSEAVSVPASPVGRISDIWGERTPHGPDDAWPRRADENILEGVAPEEITWTRSACVLCSNGCGLDVGVRDGRIVGVRGRAVDTVNHGRLGPKGLHGWRANTVRIALPVL